MLASRSDTLRWNLSPVANRDFRGAASVVSILLLLFVVFPSTAQSQTREFRFQNLTVEDGLPLDLVTSIVQDRRGFIWVGTTGGLARYDGRSFKVYKTIPGDSTSLPSDLISSISLSKTGDILVGTIDGDICELRIPEERFRRSRFQVGRPERVNSILGDQSGMVWVGTEGNGLYILDSLLRVLAHFRHDPRSADSLSSSIIYSMVREPGGRILIATPNGLNVFDATSMTFATYRHGKDFGTISSDTVRTIFVDSDQRIWIGTNRGLDEFKLGDRAFDRVLENLKFVSAIREHDAEHLLVGTFLEGLKRMSKRTRAVTHLGAYSGKSHDLLSNSVVDLFVDDLRTTWIATDRGISRITARALQFGFYSLGTEPRSKFVAAIVEDKQKNVWIGSWGLRRMTFRAGSALGIGPIDSIFLPDRAVASLLCDRDGVLWIGTSRGLFRRLPFSTRIEHVMYPYFISVMGEDSSGILWIGTRKGLFGFNKSKSRTDYEFAFSDNDSSGIRTANITKLFVDRKNMLWIGTEGGGLYRLNRIARTFNHYIHDPLKVSSLSSNRVYDICEDRGGILWITTGEGLNALDPRSETFVHYSVDAGFLSTQLLNIREDSSGYLWITSEYPWISKFNPTTGKVTNYFAEDGFHSASVMGAFAKGFGGEFLVGGLEGFTRFFPDSIHDNTRFPPVHISELLVAGKPYSFDPASSTRLELSYRENFLGFSIAVLDYVNPKRNRQAYRLEGVDPFWMYVDGPQQINYSGLPPGSYVLRVKGANSDGYWNEAGVSLPVVISPPWWETLYFRLGIFALVVVALLVLHKIRVKNLLERERLKSKISAELHDEIGSGLTRIALLTDIVQQATHKAGQGSNGVSSIQDKMAHFEDVLSRIGRSARELHDAMSDVVWSINPKNDTMESFVQRATKYMNEVCEARGIELSLYVAAEIRRLEAEPEMLHNILLVTKESMANVVRHSQCTKASVEIRRNRGTIDLTIADNGNGFDSAAATQGNGLRNMKRRIELLRGNMNIQTVVGGGTVVAFSVPTERAGFEIRSVPKSLSRQKR